MSIRKWGDLISCPFVSLFNKLPSLNGFYKELALMKHVGYSIREVLNMTPFERDILLNEWTSLQQYINGSNKEQE